MSIIVLADGWITHHALQTRVSVFGDEKLAIQTRFTQMDWYSGQYGYVDTNVQQLALVDDGGRVYLLRNEKDQSPVVVETGLADVRYACRSG